MYDLELATPGLPKVSQIETKFFLILGFLRAQKESFHRLASHIVDCIFHNFLTDESPHSIF